LTWKVPDNGGSDITKLQDLPPATLPVAKSSSVRQATRLQTLEIRIRLRTRIFLYRVSAVNGQGEGSLSNEIDLTITLPPPPEDACVVPA